MNVLVVDDSIVYRSQVSSVLKSIPGVDNVTSAPNGKIAISKLEKGNFDLMILDIEMPEMNGLDTVKEVRARGHNVKIIMFSGINMASADITLMALTAGADDFVVKPGGSVTNFNDALEQVKSDLLPKISQFLPKVTSQADPVSNVLTPSIGVTHWQKRDVFNITPKAVVIASSTGGPVALETVFKSISPGFSFPIFIVQHMPPVFTALLAKRLSNISGVDVKEAKNGERAQAGCAYIAPGDFHLEIEATNDAIFTMNHRGPKRNSVRPCANILFESAAKVYGNSCLGVVLTGMGEDGLDGAIALKNSGASVVIQDKDSCVVWGMPRAVFEAGAFDSEESLQSISTLFSRLSGRSAA